jgi:hypothetical protein
MQISLPTGKPESVRLVMSQLFICMCLIDVPKRSARTESASFGSTCSSKNHVSGAANCDATLMALQLLATYVQLQL